MVSHKDKYILYLVLLNGLLATVLIIQGKDFFENPRALTGMAVALAMFFLYETFVIWFMETKGRAIPARKTVNTFLGFKVGKIFLSLLFIAIYALTIKVELKRFVMVFLALYFIYLFFDTAYMISWEKDNKKKIIYGKNESSVA